MGKFNKGVVIWLTGLSGSGKTTLALCLNSKLDNVCLIDGDLARSTFSSDLGFSKEDRDENIRRIALAAANSEYKYIVIVSVISPYTEQREYARALCNNFVEVFVDCPLDVCEKRDVKGLYKRVRAGEIKNFTGIDDQYDEPKSPEIHLNTDKLSVDECVNIILNYMKDNYEI